MLKSLKHHTHYRYTKDGEAVSYVDTTCQDCRERFEQSESICAKCCEPVSNKTYLSSDCHFSGRCIARFKSVPIPERTVDKPCKPPLAKIGKVNYSKVCDCGTGWLNHSNCEYDHLRPPDSQADLASWWFAPRRGKQKPKER